MRTILVTMSCFGIMIGAAIFAETASKKVERHNDTSGKILAMLQEQSLAEMSPAARDAWESTIGAAAKRKRRKENLYFSASAIVLTISLFLLWQAPER